jgi:hypothetical protein
MPTETIECRIEELDEIMGNFDLREASGHPDKSFSQNLSKSTTTYFTTGNGGVSNSNENTRRSKDRYINNVCQVCVIITEAVEDDDGVDNLVVNAQGGNPRNNQRKEKEKVYVSAEEWRTIMSAINQSQNGNTRGFTKRSFNGIPIRPPPTQKETTTREKRVKEKPRVQRRIEQVTVGRIQ